jgi:hypothetical protein
MRTITWIAALTVVFELGAILLRFGAGFESTRDTQSFLGRWTGGLRIHHGYLGLALLTVAAVLARRKPNWARALLVLGAALVASDLIHHFLVLWPITGSPQWDWVYPE